MKKLKLSALFSSILLLGAPLSAAPMAHGDHSPKHGGQFFMAPDGVHHLEGVLVSGKELRIYIYDAHTHPASAAPFIKKARAVVQRVGADGRETGEPVSLKFVAGPDNAYLGAQLPRRLKVPLYFTVWLTFPKHPTEELFNFTFVK